jgi:SAM-dependent methyltransferase
LIRYARADDGRTMPGNDQRLTGQLPWLRRLPPDIRTVLDVGAGAGSHSGLFHSLGLTVTAIDSDATNFRFLDQIEFVEGDVMTWDDGRKFDAVFCSHVFEHVPDLGAFIQRLRSLIRDDGCLIVVVPRYEGLSCDEHWHIGWNCSQLALTLVASGFDCSGAIFAELNENVCGWGRKRQFEATQFGIAESAPFLPPGMRKSIFAAGSGNLHLPDLTYADGDDIRQRRTTFHGIVETFRESDAVTLGFGPGEERRDALFSFEPPLDMANEALEIITLQEGGPTVLRIAVDSSDGDEYAEASEYFLNQGPGLSGARVRWYDFQGSKAPTRFGAVRRIVIGGVGRAASVRCWIYMGSRPLTQDRPELAVRELSTPERDRRTSLSVAEASRAYFLRNRADRLDREVKRLEWRVGDAEVKAARADAFRVVLEAALGRVRELDPVLRGGAAMSSDALPDLIEAALVKAREMDDLVREAEARAGAVEGLREILTAAAGKLRRADSGRDLDVTKSGEVRDILAAALHIIRQPGGRACEAVSGP